MDFEFIDRPERNRHRKPLKYDDDLVNALLQTVGNGRAIKVLLSRFHSSPAKGRIWKKWPGYHVYHRVLSDDQHVAAWVEKDEDAPEPELVNGLLPLNV